ncbi:hypothetical protein Psuf_041580 [Phytohabitans suffuscus]|uniref:Uncharacterized protein n=1 Tax=Phytohabitans suffuscus TaxID=624315 RepID=A0A6F8YL38_9ACTN|nr:hypothetical protein Psuf_041580 [Phytohabitans suffuscus]
MVRGRGAHLPRRAGADGSTPLRPGRPPPPPAEPAPAPEPALAPVSGLPAELHADIVRELLAGPQPPYLPPVSGAPETTKRDSNPA